MLLLSIPVFADEGWDGSSEVMPQGSGTPDDPFLIGTAEELAYYRTEINEYNNGACAKLTADIDLNEKPWTPIGQGGAGSASSQYRAFAGEFDGDGHTVKGLKIEYVHLDGTSNIYWGFFGYIKGDSSTVRASVHDLHLEGSVTHEHWAYINASKGSAGGLCGRASSADIYGCSVDVTVKVIEPSDVYDNPAPAGGICGQAAGVDITDCINYGNITGAGSAAGMVGNGTADLLRCANYGDICSGLGHAGGFFGYVGNTAGTEPMTVSYCYNLGDISSTGRKDEYASVTVDQSLGGNAGGFIGYLSIANNRITKYSYSHCFNAGSVSAALHGGSVAGLLWDNNTLVPGISFDDIACLDTSCSMVFGARLNMTDVPWVVTSMTSEEMVSPLYTNSLNESAGYELFAVGEKSPEFAGLVDTPSAVPGDINGDGLVDEQDVTLMIGHVLGTDMLENEAQKAAANLSGDMYIDENDLTLLLQIVLF